MLDECLRMANKGRVWKDLSVKDCVRALTRVNRSVEGHSPGLAFFSPDGTDASWLGLNVGPVETQAEYLRKSKKLPAAFQ